MKISLTVIALATIFFAQNSIAQNVGIGTTTPGNLLEIKNNGATTPGIRINNTTATWQLGVGVNSANDALFGIYNSSAGNALVINSSGNVGIGTTTPNAPLSFPPTLGKKITLYPGATGNAGFAVASNRLQIYSDNPNADVSIGYDAAGTFNERFAFKPTGALVINGNAGTIGQILQSNGSGLAPTWVNSATATVHFIGESYGGGIVFYIYENGQHGLIASTTDQYNSIQWAISNSYTNAVRDGIGANSYNTEHIINNQGGGLFAAFECIQYNGGGYGDWYLPCKYELYLLYQQKTVVGGFASANYWSSSEASFNASWSQSFGTGAQTGDLKTSLYHIRAIRAF